MENMTLLKKKKHLLNYVSLHQGQYSYQHNVTYTKMFRTECSIITNTRFWKNTCDTKQKIAQKYINIDYHTTYRYFSNTPKICHLCNL